ncbi:DNA-binding transcriptional regulator, MarR family [Sanguibacter gelidistatuariae]|uniref:DNA-binding transcriptional regulator, MarR family n=1 Tax=Sanguibacter gelidistatuariae TaxID=1814289 RepID=A0A1G6RGI8_9MICO|nr:MarR family winged helix-turn-helix transcriptional regulator [Sanguibacter gelidistatuariae]SDD03503.1 DNA-binding transcriptional regulator, MarR family [Sanguibacter gelidistatuariae]
MEHATTHLTAPGPTLAPARRTTVEDDLGRHLGVLLRAYQATLGPLLAELPHGTRGYQVLVAVAAGDQPNQLALAAHLGIDRTVMTYVIDDLVASGLVERQQNPTDRRARRVVATETGRMTLTELQRRVHDAEDRLLGALAPAQRAVFRNLLQAVACGVRDVAPEVDPCEAAGAVLT